MDQFTAQTAAGLLTAIGRLDKMIMALKSAINGGWAIRTVVLGDPKTGAETTVIDGAQSVSDELAQILYAATLENVQKQHDVLAAQLEAL